MSEIQDPRPLFQQALDQGEQLIAAAADQDGTLPTPCDEWDLRALLGHLVAVVDRINHVGAGGDANDMPRLLDEVPSGGWVAGYAKSRAAASATWNDDAVLERTLTVPWGKVPGRLALLGYVQEIAVHSWDLAVTINRRDLLNADLAETVLGYTAQMVPAHIRADSEVPFEAVVDVPADADAPTKLAGFLGRKAAAAA